MYTLSDKLSYISSILLNASLPGVQMGKRFLFKHQDNRFKINLNGKQKVYLLYTDRSLFLCNIQLFISGHCVLKLILKAHIYMQFLHANICMLESSLMKMRINSTSNFFFSSFFFLHAIYAETDFGVHRIRTCYNCV